jgi:multidrug efflux system membrane fusion protein
MRTKIILGAIALALVCAATYFLSSADWSERGEAATSVSLPPSPTAAGSRIPETPFAYSRNDERAPLRLDVVPVVVAPVKKGDVPIYLSGIGTVQAYNTIAVKSQVDGVIKSMNFQEGQDVKIGDPLVIIDPEVYEAALEEAKALKAKAEALLENAKSNFWRSQQLLAKDFATQRTMDEQAMLVAQYTAEIAQYEGKIRYAQAQLDYATIRAPINGRTGIRNVDPGNLIRAADNTTIVTVDQLQPIWVIISLPAKEIERNNITPGLSDLPAFAFAENGITPLGRGQIQTVDNKIDPSTGTVKFKASFPNEQLKLWPGDFVDCRVMVEKRRDGLTVPNVALRHGPNGDFVWTVAPNNTAQPKRVRVKQTLGDTTLIDEGLDGDEMVVVSGYNRLQVGSRVEITPASRSERPEISRNK